MAPEVCKETTQKRPEIEITMLGGFTLKVGNKSISDNSNRAHQLWNLLEYLIAFRNREISHEELISALWPNDNSDNPANALKNLIYRVRSALANNGISESKEMIVYRRGAYSYNNSLPTRVDTEEFEALVRSAADISLPNDERIHRYLKALELYKGDFLPKAASEAWVVPLSTYFHSMYTKAVVESICLLRNVGRYQEIISICEKAIVVDQFEERFHEALIEAQLAVGHQQKAMAHYEYITGFYYRELGVKPSENLRSLYREIISSTTHVESDLEAIKEDLRESHDASGPFFCEYEVFKDMYQLEARSSERTGHSVFVALLTLVDLNGHTPSISLMNKSMDKVKSAIQSSLRRGDVAALFSPSQYVLMLPTLTFENGQMVMERIIRRFKKDNPRLQAMLLHRLQPLDPIS